MQQVSAAAMVHVSHQILVYVKLHGKQNIVMLQHALVLRVLSTRLAQVMVVVLHLTRAHAQRNMRLQIVQCQCALVS